PVMPNAGLEPSINKTVSLIGSAIKFTVLFMLGSSPAFGITGVAIAMCVGVVLITLLHLFTLRKMIQFYIPLIDICKMIALLVLTWWTGSMLKSIYLNVGPNIFYFFFVLIVLVIIYIGFLFLLKFITKDELVQIPILNNWIK